MKRYTKAIAAALGTLIATVGGIYLGWPEDQITTQATSLTAVITTLISTVAVYVAPKNAD